MRINQIVATAPSPLAAAARPTMHSGGPGIGGFLSDDDIDLIKQVTNTEFNWPPGAGEGIPLAAFELSAIRLDQMNRSMKVSPLTGEDLTALAASGRLGAEFVAKAMDHLDRGRPTQTGAPREDLRLAWADRPTRPTSGTVASDGSIYL